MDTPSSQISLVK